MERRGLPRDRMGADRWPVWWEQPNGGRCDWAGAPGTVLLMDGRSPTSATAAAAALRGPRHRCWWPKSLQGIAHVSQAPTGWSLR